MLKNRKQTRQFICPHIDCQVSFLTPVIEKGILFCPHCERSLLVEVPLSLDEVNKQSIDSHKKQKKLVYQYLMGALAGVVTDIAAKRYGKTDLLMNMTSVIILLFIGAIIFKLYRYYRDRLSYRIKHKKINFKAGVDTLSDIQEFTEIKKDYVDKKGVLAQAYCYHNDKASPDLKSCPYCTSQLVVKLTEIAGWRKDLYSKYDIFRPAIIPYSGYCVETDSYVDNDYKLDKVFLCLHCHTHYSWMDIKTDTLFKSAEGAPQLHKIVAL